ncbi:MAG TPA: zinc ribbon domain-containing protein [Symbiobacteriaceae bacterium]|nr:zinc ribbon domain-containing protein [Symbiobacteriaceae bacterium]
MNGRVARNGKYENRYYSCTGYIQFRDCDCLTVRQDLAEEVVVTHLLGLLDEDELSRRITERAGARVVLLKQEAAAQESRLAEIDHQLTRIRQDYRQGRIDADTFAELRAEIMAEKGTLLSTLLANRASVSAAESDALPGGDPRPAVSLLRAWHDLSYHQRKQVIHLLTERIEWDCHTRRITVRTVV